MCFHLAPPSSREHEPEAPRYTGSTVPSRSFRFLQMMTQNDQQNDSKPVPGYNKPQQLMNKYDEANSFNSNKMNTHPSRSFKFLQEMTSDQQPPASLTTTTTTVTRTGDNHLRKKLSILLEFLFFSRTTCQCHQ